MIASLIILLKKNLNYIIDEMMSNELEDLSIIL